MGTPRWISMSLARALCSVRPKVSGSLPEVRDIEELCDGRNVRFAIRAVESFGHVEEEIDVGVGKTLCEIADGLECITTSPNALNASATAAIVSGSSHSTTRRLVRLETTRPWGRWSYRHQVVFDCKRALFAKELQTEFLLRHTLRNACEIAQ